MTLTTTTTTSRFLDMTKNSYGKLDSAICLV